MHGVTCPPKNAARKNWQSLPPLPGTAPASLFGASEGRKISKAGLPSTRSVSKSRGTNRNSLGRRGNLSLLPNAVMEMNKEAMVLLNNGKMKASLVKLEAALKAAEKGMKSVQDGSKRSSPDGPDDECEEWVLVFATTLSNFGCLHRRQNRMDDALRFLQDARSVEINFFGTPSCSTMLNLSAVLLCVGSVEEALSMARDCVTASEGGDPMLHIVALHNHGVALSNHPTEEIQQSAVPVLMKALRLSEEHLGPKHPTTRLIRQRCSMISEGTHKKADATTIENTNSPQAPANIITSETTWNTRDVTVPVATISKDTCRNTDNLESSGKKKKIGVGRGGITSPVLPPIATHLDVDQRQRAKQVLNALNYGVVPNTKQHSTPSDRQASINSLQASSKDLLTSVTLRPSVLPCCTKTENSPSEVDAQASESLMSSNVPADVLCQELLIFSLHGSSVSDIAEGVSLESPKDGPSDAPRSDSSTSDVKKNDKTNSSEGHMTDDKGDLPFCFTLRPLDSAAMRASYPLEEESVACSDIVNSGDGANEYGVEWKEANHSHSNGFNETRREAKPLFPGFYVAIKTWEEQPQSSFLRFAPSDVFLNTLAASEVSNETENNAPGGNTTSSGGKSCELRRAAEKRSSRLNDQGEKEHVMGKDIMMAGSVTSTSSGKKRDMFANIIGVSPVTRRMERIQKERKEEEDLRLRLFRESEERAQREHFERTLSAINTRTRDRAAIKIQHAWDTWWKTVGKRRRELLRKRAEERERRERLRQTLLEHEHRVGEVLLQRKKNTQQRERDEMSVIPSVLRCGRKWLEKTACVRYVARRGIPREGHKEAFFFGELTKIQASWRGFFVRREVRAMVVEQMQMNVCKLQTEPVEYAALVIQMFFRRFLARKVLKTNIGEHYGPPATRIQLWFRRTMLIRRELGLDRVTKWRQEYCARLIQRAWRAYLSRLAYFMARLRYQLDKDRRRARGAAEYLQRIGRGCICRSQVGRYFIQKMCLHTVMSDLERGDCDDRDKRLSTSTVEIPLKTTYFPTPAEEVAVVAELEREKFHIGIFVEVAAERERAEWAEALRLRPFEVLRRRAHEDHLCEIELNTFRRERAAVKIQREFRRWLRIRYDESRDKTLLLIGRGIYQQEYYGRKIERIVHQREQKMGRAIFGDQAAPMREMRMNAEEELRETRSLVRTHVPFEEIRARAKRYEVEQDLKRDEQLVDLQSRDEAVVRERDSVCFRTTAARFIPRAIH